MELGLSGRTAIVLAAGGGLGGGIAATLAAEGATVAACDINPQALAALLDCHAGKAGRMMPVEVDVGDCSALDRAVEEIMRRAGPVSILVNVTGGPPPSAAAGVPAEQWRRYFDAMVVGVMHLTDLLLPGMRASGWGRIITSTSSGVVCPIPHLAISNALRATLVGWSKTLAGEVAADGVTVNVVVPGRIATDRVMALDQARAQREGRSVDDVMAASTEMIPVGRYGRVEEYGDVVAFLASERASFVNGSVIRVDGGMIPST